MLVGWERLMVVNWIGWLVEGVEGLLGWMYLLVVGWWLCWWFSEGYCMVMSVKCVGGCLFGDFGWGGWVELEGGYEVLC